jgi:hypothetical protein
MRDVVAVVEGQHVEGRVDVVAGQAVVGFGRVRVDEDVLRVVAEHQCERAEDEGDAEAVDEEDGVVRVDDGEGRQVPRHACKHGARDVDAPLLERVKGQVEHGVDDEVEHVGDELQRRVAAVRHGGRNVVGEEVVGLVMHHAVVHIVRARGHAVKVRHDHLRDGVERATDERAAFARRHERTMRGVVHGKNKPLAQNDPGDRQMDRHEPQTAHVMCRKHRQLKCAGEREPQAYLHKGEE